jgi:hypothetical protein
MDIIGNRYKRKRKRKEINEIKYSRGCRRSIKV